ncbi:lipopolysaccharide assembly protein LapB [Pelomicrobium methylotrophicum]|uniref:Lipopolysaccharide assembly protein B n=1 Tax=Pelomicrobium methylotrophicum TaxID=2602750 RepID=A0A5C7EZ94_9PROT|nr:lipopolysaccharide assembly protein LapB [Pelomicrobium methylotrophicum]TXF12448.1 lipopolysaccharide assembly protein LapB [Pelomicrobium methylotrophicum]
MEFEYWWLLALPLFFALGWMAARVDIKQLLSESRRVPSSYFKGLNFLLNEQPDKAIEAFIEVVKVDPETIELHFALGSLFRRRGEVERAIRMHQNLLDRNDLPQEFREDALYELAQDYFKAGLLDRAEELLLRLEGTRHEQAALRQLLEIYETEKDWEKAIATSRRMDSITGQSSAKDIANYYCELAANAITHSRPEEARQRLREALEVNRKCARANVLLGELEMQLGRPAAAIEAWKKIEFQNPAYFALVAERLMEAYRQLGKPDEGLQLLRGYLALQPSVDLLDTVFRATLELQGTEAAYRLVREELRRHPTLLGLDRLLEAQLLNAPPSWRQDLELIKSLVQSHTRSLAMYRCGACGFRARQYYWRCPACGGWETYPPLRTEEKELAA